MDIVVSILMGIIIAALIIDGIIIWILTRNNARLQQRITYLLEHPFIHLTISNESKQDPTSNGWIFEPAGMFSKNDDTEEREIDEP